MRRLSLVLLGWLLTIGSASALQLGEIEVTATPPQPIEARIALLHATPAKLQDAQVSLADARRQTQAGINIARQPEGLSLRLRDEPDNAAIVLRLPADTPPADQVFEFMVELTFSGGQLARAYGLVREDGELQARALSEAQFGPTQRSDTLYSIADALRPPAVATNQMMLALLAENPDRFNAPNVNALQRDVLLRLPQPDALQFPSLDQANAEVRQQLTTWGQSEPAEPIRADAGVATQAFESVTEVPTPQAEMPAPQAETPALRLLPPQAEAPLENATAFGAAEFSDLAEQLSRVEQANEQLAEQNMQLQVAIDRLQADVTRLEGLLMQAQTPPQLQPQPATDEALSAEAVADWMRAELAAVMAEPALVLQRPWSRGLIMGVAVFLALLLLAWLLGRRRKAPVQAADNALPAQWRPQTGRAERSDAVDETQLGPTAVRAAETASGDPLDRASELIAYGQLAQAQAVLDDALGETPDSIGLRLRLLEVLAMRGDRAGFESEAHVLHAQINDDNDPRWQRIARQGREISPDHPLFATAE